MISWSKDTHLIDNCGLLHQQSDRISEWYWYQIGNNYFNDNDNDDNDWFYIYTLTPAQWDTDV